MLSRIQKRQNRVQKQQMISELREKQQDWKIGGAIEWWKKSEKEWRGFSVEKCE